MNRFDGTDFLVQQGEYRRAILRGLTDKVANVRMVSAAGLARIVEEGDQAVVQAQIIPALEKRNQEEEDEDCRQVYQDALSKVGK